MTEVEKSLLAVESICGGYGRKEILTAVSLELKAGEIISLIGHNGSGKSTLLKLIFGLLPLRRGRIILDGQPLSHPTPQFMLRSGIVYSPQSNHVFSDLTVQENLAIGTIPITGKRAAQERIEESLNFFPKLKSKLSLSAGRLSGGEKQMLSLARALIIKPRILLLDEPSLGLTPSLVSHVFRLIHDISEGSNTTMLIAEQKVREVLKISDRTCVLRNGVVSFYGSFDNPSDLTKLKEVYL